MIDEKWLAVELVKRQNYHKRAELRCRSAGENEGARIHAYRALEIADLIRDLGLGDYTELKLRVIEYLTIREGNDVQAED